MWVCICPNGHLLRTVVLSSVGVNSRAVVPLICSIQHPQGYRECFLQMLAERRVFRESYAVPVCMLDSCDDSLLFPGRQGAELSRHDNGPNQNLEENTPLRVPMMS